MSDGRASAIGYAFVAGVLVLCLCVAVPCGVWVLFGPVNYFGCGTDHPDGITTADLVGTYTTRDGATLELLSDGTLRSSSLYVRDFFDEDVLLSSQGRWRLSATPEISGDIDAVFGTFSAYLEIAGTRTKPWLYWFEGDPDLCQLYRFDRV